MSKALKVTFTIHMIVALLFGAPLFLAPGRFLSLFGWEPVDPLLSRVLGAALLALAWSSFQGIRTASHDLEVVLIQIEAIFSGLSAVGLLRHLVKAGYPWMVWGILFILSIFAIAWLFFLKARRR
jgi:hypothetical protein